MRDNLKGLIIDSAPSGMSFTAELNTWTMGKKGVKYI